MHFCIARQLDRDFIQRLIGREGSIGAMRDGGGDGALGELFPVRSGPAIFVEESDFNHNI